MNADSQIGHYPDGHTRIARCLLRGGELLIHLPLHPPVELDEG